MARTVKDTKLSNRSERARLKLRRDPYWRHLSERLALGYRRGARGGTWIARHYAGDGYRFQSLGTADDILDGADGVTILSYDQAQVKAREWFAEVAGDIKRVRGSFTVADAIALYLEAKRAENRPQQSIEKTKVRADALIIPALGDIQVKDLTSDTLHTWRNQLAETAPRKRGKAGQAPQHRDFDPSDENARRRRQVTTNRIWAILKAALNLAFAQNRVASDAAWRKAKRFRDVDQGRKGYLEMSQVTNLINATDR